MWMAFGPVYQGVSVAPVSPGGPGGEVARHTATLIEVNGLYVIWLMATPVLLTGIPLAFIGRTNTGRTGRKILLWGSAAALLGFCAVGIWSIGPFYLPATLALIAAAIIDSTTRAVDM